jgi:hypothetical protein
MHLTPKKEKKQENPNFFFLSLISRYGYSLFPMFVKEKQLSMITKYLEINSSVGMIVERVEKSDILVPFTFLCF